MPLASGSRLGPYQILALIGAGGMGEVYRANDTRLGRDVAVKVLPQALAATPDVRARFEREARTISQLNHPNICTLFDIGRQDDTDYLVMELLEGESLAERLDRGALPPAEVLAIGRQIAEALARAHRAGIVHRDLKPGNVMLTSTGAKLLDFGLARPTGLEQAPGSLSQTPTVVRPLTREGSLVGTFQYMSPEQLEGREADARSDLWALGCILYEMATGAHAFAGESTASLIAAVMTSEPRPMLELKAVTPPALERVVRQCLRRDPDARTQSARDLGFMLELVGSESLRTDAGPAAPATAPARRLPIWLFTALPVVILSLGIAVGRMTSRPASQGSIRTSTLSHGTRDIEPAVSPDGRLVVFRAVRQEGQGIWLMDLGTHSEVKLTNDADHFPRFTADGSSILFTRQERGRQSVWRIPAIGGSARLVLEAASDADPSPDGQRIAYLAGSTDSGGVHARLSVASTDGTGARELWSRAATVLGSPRWSPDSRRIALISSGSQNAPNAVIVVDAASGSARSYPAPGGAVLSNVIWDASGNRLLVAKGEGVTAIHRGASGQLLLLDTGSGNYRPLGWLESFPSSIDVLPDGRLVLSGFQIRQNLCEVPMGARTLAEGRWLTSGLSIDRQPVYSPDGRSVMFSSNRGGVINVWEVSVESGEMHRVTDSRTDDMDPEYGPDGQSIFWSSTRGGAFEIWTARRDGSAPRQVSRDSLDAENACATPDGRAVIYSSANPARAGLWRVPVEGGEAEWLLRGGTLIPDLSPDGRYVSVITDVGTLAPKLGVFDLTERKLLDSPVLLYFLPGPIRVGRSRITPDGSAVVYVHGREDGRTILLRRPLSAWRTGEGRTDTLFAGVTDGIASFGLSPDGRRAMLSVVDRLSGLLVAEAVRDFEPPKRGK